MVLITSISPCVNFILLVSSLIFSTSHAAPTATHKNTIANSTAIDIHYTLPPLITSRTKPTSKYNNPINFDVESEFVSKNTKWYTEHGGVYNFLKTVDGMTIELPPNPPPLSASSEDAFVAKASNAQIQEFSKYAGLAAVTSCLDVVGAKNWNCKLCLKWVPDGKLIHTFTTLISDTNGFIMRSDKEKVIYLVFRGSNSIRDVIVVRQKDERTNYS